MMVQDEYPLTSYTFFLHKDTYLGAFLVFNEITNFFPAFLNFPFFMGLKTGPKKDDKIQRIHYVLSKMVKSFNMLKGPNIIFFGFLLFFPSLVLTGLV